MGTSSKAKANKTRVAAKPRAVLGASRGNSKGTTSSARSATKAFTEARTSKSKTKANKAKDKIETKTEDVAQPSYYPKGMLSFCAIHLDSLEMDILKRLVRLHQKDMQGDIKKILHVMMYYFPKSRTPEELFDLASDWAVLSTAHDTFDHAKECDSYWKTRIPYTAHKFIRAVYLQSQDKLDLICAELEQLQR